MRTHVAFIVATISFAIAKPVPQEPDQVTQDAQNLPIEIAASLSPGSGFNFTDWISGGNQPPDSVDPAAASFGGQPPPLVDAVAAVIGEQSAVPVDSTAAAISDAAGLDTVAPNTLQPDVNVASNTNAPYEYTYDKSLYGYLADNSLMPVPKCPQHYEGTCCMNGDALAGGRIQRFQIVI